MSLLTSPHQPPPPPPASASPSAVPNGPQSPKQQKEPLSHRFNEFMTSKPKIHCFRSLKRGVSSPLDTSLSFSLSFLSCAFIARSVMYKLLFCEHCVLSQHADKSKGSQPTKAFVVKTPTVKPQKVQLLVEIIWGFWGKRCSTKYSRRSWTWSNAHARSQSL